VRLDYQIASPKLTGWIRAYFVPQIMGSTMGIQMGHNGRVEVNYCQALTIM